MSQQNWQQPGYPPPQQQWPQQPQWQQPHGYPPVQPTPQQPGRPYNVPPPWLGPLILLSLLGGFGYWAYDTLSDWSREYDRKQAIERAAALREKQEAVEKAAEEDRALESQRAFKLGMIKGEIEAGIQKRLAEGGANATVGPVELVKTASGYEGFVNVTIGAEKTQIPVIVTLDADGDRFIWRTTQ